MSLSVQIEKRFPDFHLQADFHAESGILGLLGASGSGKSMTLRCIAGIEKPDRGKIVLDGKVLFDSEKKINLPPQKRQVGYLFQNYALFPNMTVKQNILCGIKGSGRQAEDGEINEIVNLLKLQGLEERRPHQLSGGQQQRTALARILVSRPAILMLDEPFSALDSYLRDKLQIEMRELLKNFKGPVLMVTHSRDEAYHLCGRIGFMDRGRLEQVRETKGLFADPGTKQAALMTGCKNIVEAEKAGDRQVYVPKWGTTFHTKKQVEDNLWGIGIRAHYFNLEETKNCYSITPVDEMEEPFEWIVRFRYSGQNQNSEEIWWRMAKEKRPPRLPSCIGVAPEDILLLYEGA